MVFSGEMCLACYEILLISTTIQNPEQRPSLLFVEQTMAMLTSLAEKKVLLSNEISLGIGLLITQNKTFEDNL